MARTLFDDCALDPGTRILYRRGQPVHLTPKAFDLLEVLLASRPRAVSKHDLMVALWPGVAVTEGSLANLVSEIRLATGDSASVPRVVRTVHRFGYAFCGEARSEDLSAPLPVHLGPRFSLRGEQAETELAEGDNLIGRANDCRLRIDSSTVSRHHARIRVQGDEAWLEDLGSKNGTRVEGHTVATPRLLRDREEIQVGSIHLHFCVSSPLSSTDSCTTGTSPLRPA
jgi:DNA-binding winged helix-turn-helix (wHTH) protein